ncbi:hypothetical protein ACFQE1_02790 [Halobium palmae]|uniref:DUF4129 domain-containing protein n=1 Tax=Halobium palmae TaxID=1776492 RepID=A0ABD5RVA7_9EURY
MTPANNTTTVQHENPEQANEDGNLNAVEGHLQRVLANRLSESAIQLNQGQYEQAQALLGDEYAETYGQYVDVAGETEETTERFNRTRSRQREYASTVQEFQSTYDAYREAKRNGNEARARRLARRLAELAQRSNQTATQLNESYTVLANRTGANLSEASTSVEETQTNISTTAQTVTDTELQRTRLSVTTERRRIAFTDPTQLSGRLTTQNGAPIANEEITLRIGGRNFTTGTDESGTFSLRYRPVTLPRTTTDLAVRYVPTGTSLYLGTNTSVPVEVEPTDGTFTITAVPEQTAFGEQLTIRGRFTVEDTPVPQYPVRIELGNQELATVRTSESGRFEVNRTLPAEISDGSRQLLLRTGVQNRSVTAETARRTVDVRSTQTTLTLDGGRQNGTMRRVGIAGTLRTESGTPLAGQSVSLRANGTTLTTVETDANGSYGRTIRLLASIGGDGETNVTLVAVFGGDGTNLERARAQTEVTVTAPRTATGGGQAASPSTQGWLDRILGFLQPDPSAGSGLEARTWFMGLPRWLQVGLPLAVVLLAGLGVRSYRHGSEASPSLDSETNTEVMTSSSPKSDVGPTDQSPLAAARTRLQRNDHDGAVQVAYERAREAIATELGETNNGTHWEFFIACQSTLSGSRHESIQRLTEWYEQAAYGPNDVSESTARDAIDVAASLLGDGPNTEAAVADGGSQDET